MEKRTKLLYIFSITSFIIGLRIALTWSYTSRLVGVFLVIVSLLVAYINYKKSYRSDADVFNIDVKQTFLGFFLIIIDLLYNIISSDTFKSFDHGVIFAGIIIILLNVGAFKFLKLNKLIVSFSTYFIFVTMVLYGFLFSGLPFILGDKDDNLLFEWVSTSVIIISTSILNLLGTASYNDRIINFNGFNVGIGDACSGVESLSVFFSSVIAYMVAVKMKNIKKMFKYLLLGGVLLYFMNIVRVLVIILVGRYMGVEEMLFVHYNLGWVFFLIGMGVFWYFVLGDFDSEVSMK